MIKTELHRRFCRQMKAWREYFGWTQTALASILNVKPSVVSQLESGRNSPTLDTEEAVAFALGLSTERFMYFEPANAGREKATV